MDDNPQPISIGDRVRITQGWFEGRTGTVEGKSRATYGFFLVWLVRLDQQAESAVLRMRGNMLQRLPLSEFPDR